MPRDDSSEPVEIVNRRRTDTFDVYAGRGPNGQNMLNTSPHETGWLGNPFEIGEHGDRETVIDKFERAFALKLQANEPFRQAVADLEGQTLACWCTPKSCHCDVIGAYLAD